ncbi:MAG: glutathione S-transferase family protein [Alphaproteobacteria bacterium]
MSDIVIYGPPQSTFTRTARMACAEKGVSYKLQPLEFGSAELLALHPFGKVPAMSHGEFKLYETNAICRYIEASFPGPALLPADTAQRAQVDQWVSAISDYFYKDMIRDWVLQYFFPRGPDGQPDQETIKAAVEKSRGHLEILNAAIDGRNHVVGSSLTIADLFVAPIMTYVSRMPEGPTVLEGLPHIHMAGETMIKRQSYTQTLPPPPGG